MLRSLLLSETSAIRYTLHSSNRWPTGALSRKSHHASAAIIKAYELNASKQENGLQSTEAIRDQLRSLRGATLSKQEAFLALQFCLRVGYFEKDLLSNCMCLVESGYYNPVLKTPWNGDDSPPLKNVSELPNNCFDAVNGMPISDKATMWQDRLMKMRRTPRGQRETHTSRGITDVDPEKREIFTTRKLGKVVDPKPLRVRVRDMPPGKKLCSAVAFQLREAVDGASLTELGDISTMFAARLPLSGQLNDDTMELLAERLGYYTPEELATQISHIAIVSSAATARYVETWSHRRALGSTRASQAHRLYRIGRKTLPKQFLTKLSVAAELYARERVTPVALGFRLGYHMDATEQQFFTLRSLARSDTPLSMTQWDLLLASAEESLDGDAEVNARCVIWLLDAINAAKYTTLSTIHLARMLTAKCEIASDVDRNHTHVDTFDVKPMLRFVEENSLGDDAKRIIKAVAGVNDSISDS
ncbi:hypothetical protein, conserved [Babesia bigemina]|uniref:Uncharacterized protein n=1 Tax=Babesia bigemina TaxID=5866 RepID=A0A061D102_BABBI|nr:hypothetical protein, conserved [Babesia bigemina]CDR94288.1 hypothetical protein, conserved [Babesia bigemina]|eukprot:XP_012766474.1 hypothetical protein, conserved [Babesia bigemina]